MVYPAGTAPEVPPAARMASVRFPDCRWPAAHGMKRSLPFVKRQHCWAADRMMRPAGNGSDHHRYGEVKTRLTNDASHAIANLLPQHRGVILAAAPPANRVAAV